MVEFYRDVLLYFFKSRFFETHEFFKITEVHARHDQKIEQYMLKNSFFFSLIEQGGLFFSKTLILFQIL